MIITCEACNTSFNLDDKMIKPTGSKVRCSVCANVFKAFPPAAPAPVDDAVAAEPAPQAVSGTDTAAAAAAAMAPAEPDRSLAGDRVEAPEKETAEHAAVGLLEDETDLDFALSDEPEAAEADAGLEDDLSSILDEDLADIGFEAESEPDAGTAATAMDDAEATILASLDDDSLDLDLPDEPAVDDGSATVLADLDSDELDLSIEEKADMGETVLIDLDQEDLQLDVSPGPVADSEGAAGVVTDIDDEGLDLENDFSLEPEAEAETGPTADDAAAESLDDLSLDFDLETDDAAAEAGPVGDAAGAADDELDLVLDLGDEGSGELEPAAETPELTDDLDLSSLEGMLDDQSGDEDVTIVVDEHEAPEPDLQLDDAEPKGDTKETLADLEFELDEEGKTGHDEAGGPADLEVDLSEIEKMLEEPQTGVEKFASVPEQDLDLDIEASLETEKWMSDAGKDDLLVSDEELDLSELEQVLEDVDGEAREDVSEDQELELDLSEEKASVAAAETVAVDSDLDFDLSDFEDGPSAKSDAGSASREPADMELEFEVEEDGQKARAAADEGLEETVAIPEAKEAKAAAPVKEKPVAPPVGPKPVPRPKPAGKGMSKSLVFLLVIAILGGAGYGTYYLLKQSGIEIPYLSEYLKPKVQDPGNLKLTTFEINSRFVDNANVGKLFVISGKVKNGYSENRGMITLLGKIFSSGKVPIHEETVYCGNVMSDLELANLEWDKIKARLANRLGDNRSNVKIEPGKSIPFMVVFSGLPEDLEEFTIEVVGSTSLK